MRCTKTASLVCFQVIIDPYALRVSQNFECDVEPVNDGDSFEITQSDIRHQRISTQETLLLRLNQRSPAFKRSRAAGFGSG
jgi:hypothetical protein